MSKLPSSGLWAKNSAYNYFLSNIHNTNLNIYSIVSIFI